MSNKYLNIIKSAILRHGRIFQYKSVGEKNYDIETGSASGTDIITNIKAYKQHIVANQYTYPTLIGKQVNHFYIASDSLPVKPKTQDIIVDDSYKYTVVSVMEQEAQGELVLFKVVTVEG